MPVAVDARLAFCFPGQGSQAVGMGRAFHEASPVARAVFEEASDALELDVAKLCFEGPESDLQLTANTQPAVLTVSTAGCVLAVSCRSDSGPSKQSLAMSKPSASPASSKTARAAADVS